MLNKPADWDNVQGFTGDYEQLPPGGHICQILSARVETTKEKKKPMLVLALEIAEGSQYDGIYKRKHEGRIKSAAPYAREQPAWPCVYRQVTENDDGNTNQFYKGLVDSLHKSNPEFQWDFNESTLAGKKIGFVFREEEFRASDGTVAVAVKPFQARSIEAIQKGVKVPDKKPLDKATANTPSPYVMGDVPF